MDLEKLRGGQGQALYRRGKTLIPGGTQLLSKRPEMFLPDYWPAYFRKAQGITVEDLDGNRFRDMGYHGIGACVLGYAHPAVDAAVKAAIDCGVASTLNAWEEVALAERLVALHPWADMVRYAKGGGEMLAIAIRIARAAAGRDLVAMCGYHGWHDWYLAANLRDDADALKDHLLPGLDPLGVPSGLRGTVLPFGYNRLDELRALAAEHGARLAAIVIEPVRSEMPAPGFLEEVRAIADRLGAVLIFDEVTAGFRMNVGGVHMTLGVTPDLAIFAKALGNGYPVAALIGRRAVMEVAQETFISSTAWTERTGFAAALATLDILEKENVPAHLNAMGERVRTAWQAAADAAGVPIRIRGLPPLSTFAFEGDDPRLLKTCFVQLMLEADFLATQAFYATAAHTGRDVDDYAAALYAAFRRIAEARDGPGLSSLPRGPLAHAGFARLA
ncbi:MAG: aminotransferase class III-fold pyridoxal phosphate-dependent enzyme [Bauldia sp.]|nr:aminotransferase class III-fold pyridoxal phosphate-dependent enzyme [Bauldia sp.]